MEQPDHRSQLAAARLWAANRFPYLATAIFASPVVVAPGIGTVAVDERWRLYVDPSVVTGWTAEQLGGAIVHHLGHLLRDHAARAKESRIDEDSADDWLDATDAEINDDLVQARIELPEDSVTPDLIGAPDGRLAEEYFEHVRTADRATPSDEEPQSGPDSPSLEGLGDDGDDGDGDGDGDGVGGAGTASAPDQASDPDQTMETDPAEGTDGDHHRHGQDCGSGAHGIPREWEQEFGSESSEVSDYDQELVKRKTASEILEAGKEPGTVPAGLRRWAESVLSAKVDWRRVLAAEIRAGVAHTMGAVDYTYSRPSRRASVSGDVVLPALRRPVPEVAVVCDTSASMNEDMLAGVLAEVEGLLKGVGVRTGGLRVLACDTAVDWASRVTNASQIELTGGGGTDMGVGISAAAAAKPPPAAIVVLTDGYTPWPDQAPKGSRVIVGMMGDHAPPGPQWARVVQIDETSP